MPKKHPEMIEGYAKPKTIFVEGYKSQVMNGCKVLGIPYEQFKEEDIPKLVKQGKMTPYTPVKGTVRCVRSYFHHVGIRQPKNLDIPEELRSLKFTGRKFYDGMTLGKIRRMPEKQRSKLFIKARDIQKAWSGNNADDETLQNTGLFPDNTPLFCCDYKPDLIDRGCLHIRDGKIIPNGLTRQEELFVKQVVETWKTNVHSAYRLDLGRLNNKFVITELNEVWSSGHSVQLKQDVIPCWSDPNYDKINQEHQDKVNKEAVLLLLARWKDFKLV